MSAAERLKALDTEIRADDDAMGELSVYAPWLLVALPQIVAVVEAAEAVSTTERTGVLPDFMPLGDALAALDDALGSDEGIHNAFDANQWD